MTNSLCRWGELHAPYFIFLRCEGRFSDAGLLGLFGLSAYRRVEAARPAGRYAVLADGGPWTLLADDWSYTLWHMPSTRPTLARLAERCDVFACSIGDCDHSFDFDYYQGGRLVRHYVVADPDFRGGRVVEDVGDPLPGEASAFRQTDEVKIVLGIAACLGIKTGYTDQDLRIYAVPDRNLEKPS